MTGISQTQRLTLDKVRNRVIRLITNMMKGKQHDRFFHHTCVEQSWSQHFWDLCHSIRSPCIRQCVGLQLAHLFEGNRLISHAGTSACATLGGTQVDFPSIGSLFCCVLLFVVWFFVCKCTVITQIYYHNCSKFGLLLILPSLVSLWLTWFRNSHHNVFHVFF